MNLKALAIIGALLLLIFGAITVFQQQNHPAVQGPQEASYSALLTRVEKGEISQIVIHNDEATVTDRNKKQFKVILPPYYDSLQKKAEEKGVEIKAQSSKASLLMQVISGLLPIILIIGLWVFFMRQMQGGGRGAMGFGKSKARLLTEHKNRVTFNDVAGVDEAKEDLREVVDFLKDPSKFQKLGGKIPKGCLLVGPPGTGKTLLARAVAGEAGVPFFSISGSDFVEMFVGVGASRVRDMFEQAKKNAPCIIFIDEIDAVGRHRGAGHGGGNDEREQTLNQLLVEMDGFEAQEGIIIIAATNRPDVLDTALLRPGRFDRQVTVPNPDLIGREAILRVHMKPVPLAVDVDVKVIARGTPGFSGADLANLVNEAALMAARKDRKLVTMRDFEDAKDKVLMGAERKSLAMSEEEKKNTAYHEGGHAIVALSVPKADPVHKATIIPRGRALGMVMQLPEGDRYSQDYTQMTSRLAILMAGRVAEELILGKDHVTSGASSDIEQATRLAKAMVTRWGYSEALGFVNYKMGEDDYGALGRDVSEVTAQTIDQEVRRLVQGGYDTAKSILTEKMEALHRLAKTLLELETLSGDEIQKVMNGETIVRDETSGVAIELSANLAVPETTPEVPASSSVPEVQSSTGASVPEVKPEEKPEEKPQEMPETKSE